MIKKKIIIFLVLLLPINVYAETGRLNVACAPQTVNPGNTINCTLSATTDFDVSSMEIPFALSSNLKATGFKLANNNMSGNDISDGRIGIYTASDIPAGTIQIGTLTIKVDENATSGNVSVSFTNIKFSDSNFTTQNVIGATSTIVVNIPKAQKSTQNVPNNNTTTDNNNTDNKKTTTNDDDEKKTTDFTDGDDDKNNSDVSLYLSDLRIDGYNINFNKNIYEYTITIKNETSLLIKPVLEDSIANYEIIGNSNLTDGSVISILVSDGNSRRVYHINIRKDVIKETNYTLLVFIVIIALLVAINVFRIVRKMLIKGKKRE